MCDRTFCVCAYRRMLSPIFCRRHSHKFLKLPHKVQFIVIPAEIRQAADIHIASGQIKFCQLQTGIYDILLTGTVKKLLIQMLEIREA